MTNAQAVRIAMSFDYGVSEGQIEFALANFGLLPGDTFTPDNTCKINAAAATVLAGQIVPKSISEGGYSISFDISSVKNHLAGLARNSCGLYVLPPELAPPSRKVRALNVQ